MQPLDIALKAATVFLSPLGVCLLLALLGLLINRRALTLVALLLLWAFSTPWLALRLTGVLEAPFPLKAAHELPTADAIVVLGGALYAPTPPRNPQGNLTDAADRIDFAAALHRAGKAPLLIYSGGPYLDNGYSEASGASLLLQQQGVPATALVSESASHTTRENAALTLPILQARQLHRVLLVTSALHMQRGLANFSDAAAASGFALELIAAPCDPVMITTPRPWMAWLPRSDALDYSRQAVREGLGLLWRRLGGR